MGTGTLRVVVAPDSFKGSAGAPEIARAIANGWLSVRPHDVVAQLPMADGGEGTLDVIEKAVPGALRHAVLVDGPDDCPVDTHWLLLPPEPGTPGGTGVVELANTSGIGLLDPLLPLTAHTRGFGQAIAAALAAGVSKLLLAVGGSSSTDGGAGALSALGARFRQADGSPIADGNAGLAMLADAGFSGLPAPPAQGVRLLTDVRNPLLGERGAARVFGPQKGASPAEIRTMERNLECFRDTVANALPSAVHASTSSGAGAAGGTGFGMMLWGARASSGAAEVAELIGLTRAISDSDVVITGEGSYDAQTNEGKVAQHVLQLAGDAGKAVFLAAGRISSPPAHFAYSVELSTLAGSASDAFTNPLTWAFAAGTDLATRIGTRRRI